MINFLSADPWYDWFESIKTKSWTNGYGNHINWSDICYYNHGTSLFFLNNN
jgi:hypothetical protein